MEKILIVGAGPAGYTAAVYAARAELHPLVFEGLQPGGQLMTTTDIENFPGFPEAVSGPDLMLRMRRQAERFGAHFESALIARADFTRSPLRLVADDGRTFEGRTAIVATGASARYLGLPSEQALVGRGVSACATCDGALYRNLPVAVLGGGDTAMEEALFLTRFASQVLVVHRRDAFRASAIMAARVRQHPKIKIAWNSVVEEVLDVAKNEVTGLRLRDLKTGQTIVHTVSAVFVAIGHDPNSKPFVGQLEMDAHGYIVTNNTRTRVPGVFACGDVQDSAYRQAVTAAGSGCMAALEAERYLRSLGE